MTTKLFDWMTSILVACALFILLGVAPVSAQTVTYLHTDAAGSPVAATDANGDVIWRQSYRPYGERINSQPASATNRQFFHDKPFDQDTGLSYFGARYHDPVVGRFMGVDPQGFDEKNLHSFNRYAYGNNNPYKFKDPDGAWPVEVRAIHQRSIDRVLGFLPARDRAILRGQQFVMDENQANEVQFRHALSVPGQNPEQTWKAANDYVRNELGTARDLEKAGQHQEALRRLGNAIHTMQDATSPAHKGYQVYDNNWSVNEKYDRHIRHELNDPRAGSELDAATLRAWRLFKSDQPLPSEILQRP